MKSTPPESMHPEPCCPEVPELKRLQYFYGQMLGSQDFRDEQTYFREKLKLLNRCLHGYGVVCGLKVTPEAREEPCDPDEKAQREKLERELGKLTEQHAKLAGKHARARKEERKEEYAHQIEELEGGVEDLQRQLDELCPPTDEPETPTRVVIDCGLALDCHGNEILLRRPYPVDLARSLSPADLRRLQEEPGLPLYLSICFCEMPVEPVRPVTSESCATTPACMYAKLQDSYRIVVSLDPPPADERCETCCCPCAEPCLLLARIDNYVPGQPAQPEQIDNDVRRRLATYEPTTITGINWVHGGVYTDDRIEEILGREGAGPGLEFRFSRPVLTSSLRPGVVDAWVIEGEGGRAGGIYNIAGEIFDLPPTPTTDRLRWRQTSDDKPHSGDRVLILLRADFVLDECCRPVDGEHVGGRVPLVSEAGDYHPEPDLESCETPPGGYGPWRSGNGRAGGTFESWMFVE